MTLQNIRFIGGTKNNLFDKIAPSTNVIRDRDFEGNFNLNEPAPKGERYTRRRLEFIDALSRYEETCFVLDSMDDAEAADLLHSTLMSRNGETVTSRTGQCTVGSN